MKDHSPEIVCVRSVGEVFETKEPYRGQNNGAMEWSFVNSESGMPRWEAEEELKDCLGLFSQTAARFDWINIVGRV